ncbi:Monocarboxylate transporter 12, partial [Frankliniella fusca]
IITIPILQNFGLVFRDVLLDLGMSTTKITVLLNVNNAFGLALGLFNGPILRRFSYRKVALFGSTLVFGGMVLTAFARSFIEFLICYGIIVSAGYNLTMASFSYAVNSYFRKRRSEAMGFAMTVTGLGPVFMPLLISLAMKMYGARGTALLLGGLSLHSVVGACLLQPVRWHLVKTVPEDAEKDKEQEQQQEQQQEQEMVDMSLRSEPLLAAVAEQSEEGEGPASVTEVDDVEDHGADDGGKTPMLARRRFSTASHKSGAAALSRTTSHEHGGLAASVWASMASINADPADFGGSILALNAEEKAPTNGTTNGLHKGEANGSAKLPEEDAEPAATLPLWRRWLRAVVLFFDLNLLRDPIFLNMVLGLSIAVFAEINFSMLTPFILGERHFETQEIATFVTCIAVADIIFRFLAPFVKRICKQPVRVMYITSLVLLILTRTVLVFSYSFEALIGVMLALGVAKGLRTVYWVLVIPDNVPIERVPSAQGLQSITNGIVFMALGPLIGVVKDVLGNYNHVIITFNVMTAITVVMWLTEFAILRVRRRSRSAKQRQVEDEEKMTGKKTART